MIKRIVEIGDEKGKSFKLEINIGGAGDATGYWRTMDKGFVKYNSGVAQKYGDGSVFERALFLSETHNTWGIKLYKWCSFWGVNDQGTGSVLQPWVLGLEPGSISWVLLDS
jgi:hypothetical protein